MLLHSISKTQLGRLFNIVIKPKMVRGRLVSRALKESYSVPGTDCDAWNCSIINDQHSLSVLGQRGVFAPRQEPTLARHALQWRLGQAHRSARGLIFSVAMVMSTLSLTSTCALASRPEGSLTALAALHIKADKAHARDKCFLYAKLISQTTNLAAQEFDAGDSERAMESLKQVQSYAERIYAGVAENSRNLVDAEMLMRRTSLRLTDMLRAASEEDRPTVEATLKQLNQIHAQLMIEVFKK